MGLWFLVGCSQAPRRLGPGGWLAAGDRSDSVLQMLDSTMLSYGDPSRLTVLVSEYCRLSVVTDPDSVYRSRRLYWRGTAMFMNGETERGDSLRRMAFELCDSARFPHDYRVFRLATEQISDFKDNLDRYRRYSSDFDAFVHDSDFINAATRGVMLSGLMTEAGLHTRALDYMLRADSLLDCVRLYELKNAYRSNLAACRFATGDTIGAVATLRELLDAHGECGIMDPVVRAIINFNIYQMNGDTGALMQAWATAGADDSMLKFRPLVASALVKEWKRQGDMTPPLYLLPEIRQARLYSYPAEDELYIAEAICDLAAAGDSDFNQLEASLEALTQAVDRYRREMSRNEVVAAETAAQVNLIEQARETERQRHRRNTVIVISGMALLLVAIALFVIRSAARMRRQRMMQQLEVERLRRHSIAANLMLAEITRNRPTDGAQTETNQLAEDVVARRDDEFMRLFAGRYPAVGKTGRKLALLIWRGLDTIEIARTMNISKESVMQARWRLRTAMRLSASVDLDVTILSIRLSPMAN